MNQKFFSTNGGETYVSLWNKYRPAILKLMVDSEKEPQQYQFYGHEFKALNPKEKKGFAFTMQASEGKALNSIKSSVVAQDLLYVLAMSKRATELMGENTYEFTLNKQFNLSVTKLSPAE
ncbi:MAG: hypothetical protein KBF45_02390 [Cyclobacteriaceae bacterium]|jgi:hypothetical protein|nr:hypothetical protein [Cyclobacteriaceae bacterium]